MSSESGSIQQRQTDYGTFTTSKVEGADASKGGLLQACSNYFAPNGIHTGKDALVAVGRGVGVPFRLVFFAASVLTSAGFGMAGGVISGLTMTVAYGMEKAGVDSKHVQRTRGVAFELNKVMIYLGTCQIGGYIAGLDCLASGRCTKEQFHASLTRSLALNHLVGVEVTQGSNTVKLSKDFQVARDFFQHGWDFLVHKDEQEVLFKPLTGRDIAADTSKRAHSGGYSRLRALVFLTFGELLHNPELQPKAGKERKETDAVEAKSEIQLTPSEVAEEAFQVVHTLAEESKISFIKEAAAAMLEGKYSEALVLLGKDIRNTHPETFYLRAICFAMTGRQGEINRQLSNKNNAEYNSYYSDFKNAFGGSGKGKLDAILDRFPPKVDINDDDISSFDDYSPNSDTESQ